MYLTNTGSVFVHNLDSTSGNITIHSDNNLDGSGSVKIQSAAGSHITTTGGNVLLKGDLVDIESPINVGTGTITIEPVSNKKIYIGGSTDDADASGTGGTLDISNAEFGRMTASEVIIGSTSYTNDLFVKNSFSLNSGGLRNFNLTL